MKRVFITLCVILSAGLITAQGFEVFTVGECSFVLITSNQEVELHKVDKNCVSIDIPSTITYNGISYVVTSIGKNAFAGTAIYKDKSNWDAGALYVDNCLIAVDPKLKGDFIIKPNSRIIANETFKGCNKLTSITFPNSVTSIGDAAFASCCSLTSVNIPENITNIGRDAFAGTAIYKDKSNWDSGAFYIDNCLITAKSKIKGDYIVKSNTRFIADYAFSDCHKLTSITIPQGITSIGDYAFSGCSSLKSVIISNTATSIGDFAFWRCRSLGSITIPNGVTSIGDCAFYGCSSLKSITIPNSLTRIGSWAFYGTAIHKDKSKWEAGTLYIDNCLMAVDPKLKGDFIIKPNTIHIANGAFKDCSSLTSISIPHSVISIGLNAFRNCSSLTSITIPNSVKSIGWKAFLDCEPLKEICIPNSVTSIGRHAFDGCDSLLSITYQGTMAQWKKIKLGYFWKTPIPTAVLHCTDGDVKV